MYNYQIATGQYTATCGISFSTWKKRKDLIFHHITIALTNILYEAYSMIKTSFVRKKMSLKGVSDEKIAHFAEKSFIPSPGGHPPMILDMRSICSLCLKETYHRTFTLFSKAWGWFKYLQCCHSGLLVSYHACTIWISTWRLQVFRKKTINLSKQTSCKVILKL